MRQGAEAGPSIAPAGPLAGVEARFGPPNQASTVAIQTCLQTGNCQPSFGHKDPHMQHSKVDLAGMTVLPAYPLLHSACKLNCSICQVKHLTTFSTWPHLAAWPCCSGPVGILTNSQWRSPCAKGKLLESQHACRLSLELNSDDSQSYHQAQPHGCR